MVVAVLLLVQPLIVGIPVMAANGGPMGVRITIHQLEALDPMEPLGGDADMMYELRVNEDIVLRGGPYKDDNKVTIDDIYYFQCSEATFELQINVWENDDLSKDDEVDISAQVGGGDNDRDKATRGCYFYAVYTIETQELYGDYYERKGDWFITNGEFDGSSAEEFDAKLLFDVEVNDWPEVRNIMPMEGQITIEEGSSQTFDLTVVDREGDLVRYEWLVDGRQLPEEGSAATLYSAFGDLGDHDIKCKLYQADEGAAFEIVEWTLSVVDFNAPPVAVLEGPETAKVFQTVTFSGSGSYDPDDRSLSYHWYLNEQPVSRAETYYHVFQLPGQYEVRLMVTDGAKYDNDTLTIDVENMNWPEPQAVVVNKGTTAIKTDYDYDMTQVRSWNVYVTECGDYAFYVDLTLGFEFRVTHEGSLNVTYTAEEGNGDTLDIGCKIGSGEDRYSVAFKPTLFVSIEKRYYDGRDPVEYLYAPLPLPSDTDIDGDGSHMEVMDHTVYLWDSYLEIFTYEGENTFGGELEHSYKATLTRVDLMQLIRLLTDFIPYINVAVATLDIFINLYLDFNLNVELEFNEDLVFIYPTGTDILVEEINQSDPDWDDGGLLIEGVSQGHAVYTAVSSAMDSDVFGSMDLELEFYYDNTILEDFINYLFGDLRREYTWTLMRTQSVKGSIEVFQLARSDVRAYSQDLIEPLPLTSDVTENGATVSWPASPAPLADGYRVYISSDGRPQLGVDTPVKHVGSGETTVRLKDLDEDTEYWVVVEAMGIDGSVLESEAVQFKTEPAKSLTEGGGLIWLGAAIAIVVILIAVAFQMFRGKKEE